MRQALSFFYNTFKAKAIKFYRTREVVASLKRTHERELDDVPVNMWRMVKQKQSLEIQAARDGRFPITERKTWAHPYLPESLHRLHMPILKATPYNLRRFSETPIPRRAINLIKNTITSLRWKIEVVDGEEKNAERVKRIDILTETLKHPNNEDSWTTFLEAFLEDFLVVGAGTAEPALTPSYKRPFKMWPVDSGTIRIFADWMESQPDKPKYAQMTGLKGERGFVTFKADELLYVRDNVRTNTPFGLGRLEVCFNATNALLGVQDMATRAGSDQTHKTFLWFRNALSRGHFETIRRYIRNEAEGQAKLNVISGIDEPKPIEVQPVTEEDILIPWQELLMRLIAVGFDLSPQAVGLERDVNRNTATVMDMKDFRSAVVPVASKVAEYFTRFLIHRFLGWTDLEFKFVGLEDPDLLTKMKFFQTLYQVNATTPNRIAEAFDQPPIEGGWGDMTFTQMAIMQAKAQALLGVQGQQKMMESQQKMMQQQQDNQQYDPFSSGSGGFGGDDSGPPMQGSIFSAKEVASMAPNQVEQLRQNGMVPPTSQGIKDSMEENQPGILEELSEEMNEYLDDLEKQEDKRDIEPQKVSNKDEKEQIKKWRSSEKDRGPQRTDRKSRVKVRPPNETTSDRRFQ